LKVAAPRSPNEKLIREIAGENRELLRLLASNGRYKPKTETSSSPSG
jgi:hypothetical protein